MDTWACISARVADSADLANAVRDQVSGQLDATTGGNLVTQNTVNSNWNPSASRGKGILDNVLQKCPGDVERCVNGTREIGDVLRSRSIEDFKFGEWFGGRDFRYVGPVDHSNDWLMGEFCCHTVITIWHYHGGCLVGKVVDRNFKVIGIDALLVVDCSIFTCCGIDDCSSMDSNMVCSASESFEAETSRRESCRSAQHRGLSMLRVHYLGYSVRSVERRTRSGKDKARSVEKRQICEEKNQI
ncbi:hypothetical protein Syun_025712 [Stephania yunnanensis]|uniref:Glucose-methanol-choline oxidoreductase C-terminal domain-containing protein n=1 Tax=Stephania yunnanensis TaxID=152371 RepID=A0AAP0HV31_9MAGN